MNLDSFHGSAKKTGVALFFLACVLLVVATVFNLRFAVELQKQSCLPFTVALIRYHDVKEFRRGDIVAFSPTGNQMGELFNEKLVVKMIGAVPGDTVEVNDGGLKINERYFGPLDVAKSAAKYLKRDISSFARKEIVPEGQLLMVGTLPRTFDGRYWGLIKQEAILGTVYPIF